MNKRNDLKTMYRRFGQEIDKVPLPSEDELLALINREPAAASDSAPRRVAFAPAKRHQRSRWIRYAAAVLLMVSAGAMGWLLLRQPDAPTMADRPSQPATPAGPAADSTHATTSRPDSLQPVPLLPMADEVLLAEQPATQNPQAAADSAERPQHLAPSSAAPDGLLSDLPVMTHDAATDSSDLLHLTPDYPERPLMKDKDIKINEDNSKQTLREKKIQEARRRQKFRMEKNNNNENSDVNVIAPNPSTPQPRPHWVPTGNGHHTRIWY